MTVISGELIFWGVFIIIPLVWEIAAGFVSALSVLLKRRKNMQAGLDYYPTVTVIIPACQSEATLNKCVESVLMQDYPEDRLDICIVDNGAADSSFEIFSALQSAQPSGKIRWCRSSRGKSNALNKGIFYSSSDFIINIDSDGWLGKNAVRKVIEKFGSNEKITCITGVVVTDPEQIEASGKGLLKLLRLCELFEYIETFLIGRNFQSVTNAMFTLSGAFSCFRREALLKTQLYNSDTVGEDVHMTFQIRSFAGGRIALCEDAFFYAEPIRDTDSLYSQRQRWQRGQLEAAAMFKSMSTGGFGDFFRKFAMRVLVSDHTLAFPRLIWFFAVFYLFLENYPLRLLAGANILLYGAYLLNSIVNFAAAGIFLKAARHVRDYHRKHAYICLLMPVYRFLLYWIRVAGIINSLGNPQGWKGRSLTSEFNEIKKAVRGCLLPSAIMEYLERFFNRE